MAEKKYYKVNAANKTITLDTTVKATAQDMQDIQIYVMAGYIIRHKSQKRAEAALERIKKNGGKISKKKD